MAGTDAPGQRGLKSTKSGGLAMRRRRRRDDRGAAAVEFALVVIPVFAVLFGLIQYGMYFYSAQTGSNTVNAAVRQLSVGNCRSDADLNTFVTDQLGAASSGTVVINRDYTNPDGSTPASPEPANVKVGGTVTLTITFPTLNMHFPFVPFLSDPTVSRQVEARVEDINDQGCGS
jgi:Flp pilus assembly protein TadG